jgi:hypothetical protein
VGLTLLFLDLSKRPTTGRAALLALLLGLTSLFEPTVLVLLPAGFVWLGARIGSVRHAARLAALSSLVVALLIAPWLVRNAVTFDRFVFVKSNVGHELLIGNLPIIRPGTHVEDLRVKGVPDEHLTADEVAFVERVDEGTRTRYYLGKSLAWIRAHPGEFVAKTVRRVVGMWTLTRGRGLGGVMVGAVYVAFLVTALASLVLPQGRRRDAVLLWLFVVLLPIGNYLTVATHWRYRFPSEALLAVPAALTLTVIGRRLRGRAGDRDGLSG